MAAQILALKDTSLATRFKDLRVDMSNKVLEDDKSEGIQWTP